jgi:hypothetical protein
MQTETPDPPQAADGDGLKTRAILARDNYSPADLEADRRHSDVIDWLLDPVRLTQSCWPQTTGMRDRTPSVRARARSAEVVDVDFGKSTGSATPLNIDISLKSPCSVASPTARFASFTA